MEKVRFSSIGAVIPEGYHACRACGHKVKLGYALCLGCYRKREKILKDYRSAGMPEEWALLKADAVYPLK
jgi:hypothetical protein